MPVKEQLQINSVGPRLRTQYDQYLDEKTTTAENDGYYFDGAFKGNRNTGKTFLGKVKEY